MQICRVKEEGWGGGSLLVATPKRHLAQFWFTTCTFKRVMSSNFYLVPIRPVARGAGW